MSRREFVSRFYRSEDDYTKQIENSLKGDSYLYLPDEINFDTQSNQSNQDSYPLRGKSDLRPDPLRRRPLDGSSFRESQSEQGDPQILKQPTPKDTGILREVVKETPVISIESPGYIQTSFKDQTPKQQGCGIQSALKRLKNKLICKSKSSLDETFAYDPYKSLTASKN